MTEPTTSTTHLDCTAHAHRLEAVLARVVRERDALERELAALRASPSPSAYGLKEEHGALRKAHDEVLEVLAGNETDPETSLARSVLLRLRSAERLMVAEAPSPSAGAVPPEVTVREQWPGVFIIRCGGRDIVDMTIRQMAERAAESLRNALAAHWPKPHADAGGEVIRLREERDHFRDAYHREGERARLLGAQLAGKDAEWSRTATTMLHKADERVAAAAKAARREESEQGAREVDAARRDAYLECAKECEKVGALFLANEREYRWAKSVAANIRARAAEREKTSEAEQQDTAPSDAVSLHTDDRREPAGSRSAEPGSAPQEPGATPAPCPRCKGERWVVMSESGTSLPCTLCNGTGRAPASSPAPAAPEARGEEGVMQVIDLYWLTVDGASYNLGATRDPALVRAIANSVTALVRAERVRARDAALDAVVAMAREEASKYQQSSYELEKSGGNKMGSFGDACSARTLLELVDRIRSLRGKAES